MNNFDESLPKDKFDFESLNKIKMMEKKYIIPLIPGLLEWIQDMNWPIAPEVVKILLDSPKEVVPYIKNVFSTDDDIWKFWCLEYLVKNLPSEDKKLLISELIRLISMPTEGEKLEEVDLKARGILNLI